MKPPVEAPTSSASRPRTSIPSASSAFASLSPPRETYCGPRSTSSGAPSSSCWPGLATPGTSPARTSACACARLSASPRSTRSTSARFFTRTRLTAPLRRGASGSLRTCGRRAPPRSRPGRTCPQEGLERRERARRRVVRGPARQRLAPASAPSRRRRGGRRPPGRAPRARPRTPARAAAPARERPRPTVRRPRPRRTDGPVFSRLSASASTPSPRRSRYCPPIIPSVAWASSRATPVRAVREREPERLGEQRVAGQDGHVLAEAHVHASPARAARRRRRAPAGRRGRARRCGRARPRPPPGARAPRRRPPPPPVARRQHRPDPLAAARERVAHRLLERVELRRQRQLGEVVLDRRAQLVGATERHRPPAGPSAARPRPPSPAPRAA